MNYQRALYACMWLAVAAGAYTRFKGLGTWPLATDEYYTAASVANVARYGIPAWDCGGYYMRELTLQYLVLPLYSLGIGVELATRLVPVFCSFAVLASTYLLGKRLAGTTVACVCVALLSISLWEIEFARFGRMYVPFQAVFLCYLLALHRVVVDRKSGAYGWLWLSSLLGLLTWEGGVFLLVVNFVPNVIERAPKKVRHVATSTALLLLGYSYSAWNFRFMGGHPLLPPDVSIQLGGSHVMLPPVLASTLSVHPLWATGALVALVISSTAVVMIARDSGAPWRERVAWTGLIGLSLVNLFGGLLIGLALALLLGWVELRRASRRCMGIAAVPIAINFFFWFSYALSTDGWHRLFPGFGPGGELSKIAVVLFKYPNVFDSILFPWLDAVPMMTAVLGGLTALAAMWAIWSRGDERLSGVRLMVAVCVLMVALVGVADTKYNQTRYTFFLLPVLYLLAFTAVHGLILKPIRSRPKRVMGLGLVLLAMVGITEDFGWSHMAHIDRMDWNYRLHYDAARASHYYPRWDYRTPAQEINRHAHSDDVIIVTELAATPYLDRTDYVYRSFYNPEFESVSCDAGQRERWTGRRLLYRDENLFKVIEAAPRDVWLFVMLDMQPGIEEVLKQRYGAKVVYRDLTKEMGVYKITGPETALSSSD